MSNIFFISVYVRLYVVVVIVGACLWQTNCALAVHDVYRIKNIYICIIYSFPDGSFSNAYERHTREIRTNHNTNDELPFSPAVHDANAQSMVVNVGCIFGKNVSSFKYFPKQIAYVRLVLLPATYGNFCGNDFFQIVYAKVYSIWKTHVKKKKTLPL